MFKLTDRDLGVIAIVLLLIALMITLFPSSVAEAQGGGRCTACYTKYWNRGCSCYITQKVWRCTGWQRPRRTSGGGYNYHRYRR